jgi:hypothetical protein
VCKHRREGKLHIHKITNEKWEYTNLWINPEDKADQKHLLLPDSKLQRLKMNGLE